MARPEPRERTESPSAGGDPLVALVYLLTLLVMTAAPVWLGVRARGDWEECDCECEMDEL